MRRPVPRAVTDKLRCKTGSRPKEETGMRKNSTNLGSAMTSFIGLDLADKESTFVGIDGRARLVEEGRVATTPAGLGKAFAGRCRCRIALEVGTHSLWVDRLLRGMGHEVIVANPREVALIYRNKR